MPQMPPAACPECGHVMDGATDPLDMGRAPHPGDYTACEECTSLLRFNDDLTFRTATPQELAELPAEFRDHLRLLQRGIREIWHKMRREH